MVHYFKGKRQNPDSQGGISKEGLVPYPLAHALEISDGRTGFGAGTKTRSPFASVDFFSVPDRR
jgi:hypothetical protein